MGCLPDQLGDLADRPLRQPAGRLKRQRLGTETELKNDLAGVGRQRRQEGLVDVRRVAIALGRTGAVAPGQCAGHFVIRHLAVVDVGREMSRRRQDPTVGDAAHVMGDRCVNVVKGLDLPLGRGPRASSDRSGAFWSLAPAAFQLVKCRVELAPLGAGEKPPLQGVLQPVVVLAVPAPGQLGAGAADPRTVEDRVRPAPVIGPLANQGVESPPVPAVDRIGPAVKLAEDDPNAPDELVFWMLREIRQSLLDPGVRLVFDRARRETGSTAHPLDIPRHTGR